MTEFSMCTEVEVEVEGLRRSVVLTAYRTSNDPDTSKQSTTSIDTLNLSPHPLLKETPNSKEMVG